MNPLALHLQNDLGRVDRERAELYEAGHAVVEEGSPVAPARLGPILATGGSGARRYVPFLWSSLDSLKRWMVMQSYGITYKCLLRFDFVFNRK